MKIKWGAMVVDGSGKLGGHVASKNRGGSYFRTKVTPTNPNSTNQAAVRSRLTALSQAFRSLTADQIAGWNNAVSDFAKTDGFGDIKNPSGVNLFVKLNANLGEVGKPTINDAPLPSSVEPVVTLSATAAAGVPDLSVVFTPTPVPADTSFIIRATAQMSPGKKPTKSDFRNLLVVATAGTSPANALAAYNAKFGVLVAGRKIGIEMVPVNTVTGQKGLAINTTLIVAA
jgi:hypothetical protein